MRQGGELDPAAVMELVTQGHDWRHARPHTPVVHHRRRHADGGFLSPCRSRADQGAEFYHRRWPEFWTDLRGIADYEVEQPTPSIPALTIRHQHDRLPD